MKNKIEFANLAIRFGSKELLDYKEVVTRAFLNDTNQRKYGKTSYLFIDTEIRYLDPDDILSLAIYGRFVKSTVLQREQILRGGELLQDEREIESAPSSFFVFFVADHRIAFVPETRFAPTLSSLESTISLFVKREFKLFLDAFYRERKSEDPSFTRKKAGSEHVAPTVNLVPLTSADSIERFLKRFSKLERLSVKLVERNQDMKNGDLFEKLIGKIDPMSPSTAKLDVRGAGDGLDVDEAIDFVAETTEGGYEEVTLAGEGENAERLIGSNDDFKLKVQEELGGLADASVARRVLNTYRQQKDADNIRVSPRDPEQLRTVLAEILDPDDG